MKNKRWIFPVMITMLILAGGAFLFYEVYNHWKAQTISINQTIINRVEETADAPGLKEIIYEAEKHVVLIESQADDVETTGSGFLYNEQGDIVTNAHVIEDADIIQVRTANAHIYTAAVVGISKEVDLAVIRVPQLARKSHLQMIGDKFPEIGDPVIALGSPHGFQNTVTVGIISGMERNFSTDGYAYNNVYQISAPISQGNSGGPLIDQDTGKVIGINSVGTRDGTIGFSIPIHDVIDQINEWTENVTDDELDFSNPTDLVDHLNPDQLLDDAFYLIEYFFEGIQIRDYLISYTLLGSQTQSELSYPKFRDNYTRIVKLDYEEDSREITDDNYAKINLHVTIETKSKNEEETKTDKYLYTFLVGLENDQLRILKVSDEKV